MQHHELKKYLEFTLNKKSDKMKKNKKNFCKRTRNFKKILLLKKDAHLDITDKREQGLHFSKTFLEDFVTGVSHRMI